MIVERALPKVITVGLLVLALGMLTSVLSVEKASAGGWSKCPGYTPSKGGVAVNKSPTTTICKTAKQALRSKCDPKLNRSGAFDGCQTDLFSSRWKYQKLRPWKCKWNGTIQSGHSVCLNPKTGLRTYWVNSTADGPRAN